jgi:hypothetical protein
MLDLTRPVRDSSTNHFSRGRGPANKGRRYPADPPRVEEIVAVMRQAGSDKYGQRLRGIIVVLWRAGLRISEALAPHRIRPGDRPRVTSRPPRQGRTSQGGWDG